METQVTVEFETENEQEIPRIGQRKRVRVNGKPTTLYVKNLHVSCGATFASERLYKGSYLLTDHWGMKGRPQ